MTRSIQLPHNAADHEALVSASDHEQCAHILSRWAFDVFDEYYRDFCAIPEIAKSAFESRDFPQSIENSRQRLTLYSERMYAFAKTLMSEYPKAVNAGALWDQLELFFREATAGRYEADLALAFLHSVRRVVFFDEWYPVDYQVGIKSTATDDGHAILVTDATEVNESLINAMLSVTAFSVPYRNKDDDVARVVARVTEDFSARGLINEIEGVDVVRGGFFRNRGVYVVGRVRLKTHEVTPLILALEIDEQGIYIDAVLSDEAQAHNLFSTTRANFIVTNDQYHELAKFLHGIMPKRPLGLHYSSIGFNHFGKVAVMEELAQELESPEAIFDTAIGFPGTVAIGFQAPGSVYNLKVIRDHPTENYKWGDFEGVPSVLEKYRRVHDINRTGSMLDNAIYYNVTLPKKHFADALLSEMLDAAGAAVSLRGEDVFFHHLIVQRKMIPLPVFLEQASAEECAEAVISLGYCIKNNMAGNIFNRDLDGRNYGVGSHIRVYLFDYDALETFTEVKIRSNQDRYDGEEDIPSWYFEDGVIFLPEEIEWGLRISDPDLRKLFRDVHGDLTSVPYWERIQEELREGKVPRIQVYPRSCRI